MVAGDLKRRHLAWALAMQQLRPLTQQNCCQELRLRFDEQLDIFLCNNLELLSAVVSRLGCC